MTEKTERDRRNLLPLATSIRMEADYQAALARIQELMNAEFGTPQGDELNALTDRVELYEARQMPEFAASEKPKQGPPQ